MSNPFEDLRQKRLDEEAKLREQEEAKRNTEDQRLKKIAQEEQHLSQLSNQFDDVVTRVLQHLREARYPNSEFRYYKSIPRWEIGYITERYDRVAESSYDSWEDQVSVEIVLKNDKSFFKCKTTEFQSDSGGTTEECLLVEQELIKKLQLLHQIRIKSR